MGSSAPAIAATAAVYLFAGLLFATVFARRSTEREAAVFALLSFALAEHSLGELVRADILTAVPLGAGDTIQWVGLIGAYMLLVHYSVRLGGERGNAVIVSAYLTGGVFEALALTHHLETPLREAGAVVPSGPSFPALAYIAGVIAVLSALLWCMRAYAAGRRDVLPTILGISVLLATTLNEVARRMNLVSSPEATDFGFLTLVIGAGGALAARYAKALSDVDQRSGALRQKTRELRAAGEELSRTTAELLRAEEELGRKEQLAVVGELAAVIAHEVRNPLAIMGNAVAGLRKATLPKDDQATLLTILEEETSRLNRLVTDLLRYARPVNIQRTNFSLNEFIERALSLLKTRKTVTTIFTKPETDGRIWADANLLRQVFDNLFDNAVQAMGAAGTLTVRIRTAAEDGVDGFAVDILDTGEGMDTLVRSRAKDPFFTTRPSGTGLGLAIVDRIVDAHGGKFVLDSHAGEGTTVTVFLPYGSSSEPPPRPKSSKRQAVDSTQVPSSRRPAAAIKRPSSKPPPANE